MFYPFLTELGILPGASKWLAELISMFYLALSLIAFAINKEANIGFKYLFYYFLLFVTILIGAVVNFSSASAIILGIRHYFKYLPFFIFPLVYKFEEKDLKLFMQLMLVFLFMQLPVCVIQRFIMFSGMGTGDVVRGTVGGSGSLSIMLICSMAILYAFHLKGRITRKFFYFSAFLLFLPTTINETKITFLLLPFALLLPNLLIRDENFFKKTKKIFGYAFSISILLSAFVISYNMMYTTSESDSLFEYLKREKEGKGYLFNDEESIADLKERGRKIGRGDALVLANNYLIKDLKTYIFGIGIGNALPTKIKFLASGNEDIQQYDPDIITITNVFWEMGLIGIILQLCIYFFVWVDMYSLVKNRKLLGAVALGWCGVTFSAIISLLYLNIYNHDTYNLVFWFFTGIILSLKYREELYYR